MNTKTFLSLLLIINFASGVCAGAQVAGAAERFESDKPIEREIAGGESHSFQIPLTAGQFVRFRLQQQAIDSALILTAPHGKQLVEMNLNGPGEEESLSLEAAATGSYQLTVRGRGAATLHGSYRLTAAMRATTTTQDRKRMAGEAALIEANELRKQAGKTAQQVIEKLQQALPIWRELEEPSWTAWSLRRIGIAYSDIGRYEQANEYHEQALAISRKIMDRAGEGWALQNLGVSYLRLGRYEKAIEHFEQALAIIRELKSRAVEGGILSDLGSSYRSLSRYEKALEYYVQALAIIREMKDRASEGIMLSNLGGTYRLLSRYEKAIEYFEQALAIHREVKNRAVEGITLNALGAAYDSLGRFEKAIESYEQALAIIREVKNRASEGITLHNLGEAYRSLGRSEKAIEYNKQALAIHREVKNRTSEGITLDGLGYSYLDLNQNEKAIEYFEQALAIHREVKNRAFEGITLNNLGTAWLALGLPDKATGYHEQALEIAREVKTPANEASALNRLMLDWKTRNLPDLAIYFGKQSVNTYQGIRSNIRVLDAESQRSFLKSKEQTYRDLAGLLIAKGRLPEAEQIIRMLKEEEYFEYIRRDENNSPKAEKTALTPEEAALDKRYREVADQLTEIGTERGALLDKKGRTPEEEQRLAKLETDLVVAGQAFQKFLDGVANEMGKNADTNARAYQLRESQGLMEDLRELGKDVVALYTLVGEDNYRVILTTADFQKGYEYPIKAAELNRKVLEFREVLQNPKLDPLPLAQELYKILVGPVAKDLQGAKAQTLMWSLDGVLRYVPVAALHDGKQYLVETYRNAVFTLASQARLKDLPNRRWNALGLGVTKAHGERIPALPGVMEEMHGIIKDEPNSKGVLPGTIKLDEQFTQEAMLTGLRQRPPVVHVASHFQFQPGNETNSALLLGDGQFLSLAQLKSLPNVFGGVELLTLSACNTATGGSGANGKEVEGFGVLAQRQGAKAVVASLWPVFDTSTKELMQDFYRLREAKPDTTKAEALRQAQSRLLRGEKTVAAEVTLANRQITHEEDKDKNASKPIFKLDPKKPYAHPYFWAPFILIGNWR